MVMARKYSYAKFAKDSRMQTVKIHFEMSKSMIWDGSIEPDHLLKASSW